MTNKDEIREEILTTIKHYLRDNVPVVITDSELTTTTLHERAVDQIEQLFNSRLSKVVEEMEKNSTIHYFKFIENGKEKLEPRQIVFLDDLKSLLNETKEK